MEFLGYDLFTLSVVFFVLGVSLNFGRGLVELTFQAFIGWFNARQSRRAQREFVERLHNLKNEPEVIAPITGTYI